LKIISTEIVEQGHVAAQDIHSSSGNVLVSKGAILSPALGNRLKNWGISHIYIEGEDESVQESGDFAISDDKIRNDLLEKFSGTLSNGRMKKIFEATCTHKTQNSSRV
jgi:hypothetical protein